MKAYKPPLDSLRGAAYVKSSRSSGAQECVMVTATVVDGWVGVQDSKTYPGTLRQQRATLAVQQAAFAALLSAVG